MVKWNSQVENLLTFHEILQCNKKKKNWFKKWYDLMILNRNPDELSNKRQNLFKWWKNYN